MSEANDGAAPAGAEDTSAALAVDETNTGAAQQGDQSGDEAAAAAGEGEGEQPKPKKTAQERFDELTRARRDAERERDYYKGLADGRAPKDERHPDRQEADKDPEPDPADFTYGETDPAYIKALTAHTVRQEHARLNNETRRNDAVRTVETTWTERQQAFAKDKPDYFETLDRDWVCTPAMADAIKTSDDGAPVAYHLAQNPDEARRIAALTPLAQIREIGKLEARLAKPAAETTTTKTISDAPNPAPALRGAGGKFKTDPATTDFAAFERLASG